MDCITSTDDLRVDMKTSQENCLLDIIKELCSENKLSQKVRGKVNRIIADCDLTHHTSLHKMSTSDESTSTLLGNFFLLSFTYTNTIRHLFPFFSFIVMV